MKGLGLFLLILLPGLELAAGTFKGHRPQRYATYKAHTILPDTLQFLVKRDGKQLFIGLFRGLEVPHDRINEELIIRESRKITELVNSQRPFKQVINQMGYVSGLIAVHTDPSRDSKSQAVRQGFPYYLNRKLERCLFVFDGYNLERRDNTAQRESWLREELGRIRAMRQEHRQLLEDRYHQVSQNPHHMFDERSAVFGVCSIYFSNLARLSAHLWYYAWSSAHGDVTKTPFRQVNE